MYSQNGPESRLGSVYIYLYPYLFQYIMMMPRNLYFGVITFSGLPVSCICISRGVAKGGAFENFNYGRRVKMGGLKRRTFLHRGVIILLYQNRYSDTRLARTFGRCSSRSARSITCVDRTQHISRVRTIHHAAYSDDVQT